MCWHLGVETVSFEGFSKENRKQVELMLFWGVGHTVLELALDSSMNYITVSTVSWPRTLGGSLMGELSLQCDWMKNIPQLCHPKK